MDRGWWWCIDRPFVNIHECPPPRFKKLLLEYGVGDDFDEGNVSGLQISWWSTVFSWDIWIFHEPDIISLGRGVNMIYCEHFQTKSIIIEGSQDDFANSHHHGSAWLMRCCGRWDCVVCGLREYSEDTIMEYNTPPWVKIQNSHKTGYFQIHYDESWCWWLSMMIINDGSSMMELKWKKADSFKDPVIWW